MHLFPVSSVMFLNTWLRKMTLALLAWVKMNTGILYTLAPVRPLNFSIIVPPMALGWKTSYEVVGMDGIKIQSTNGFKLFYK